VNISHFIGHHRNNAVYSQTCKETEYDAKRAFSWLYRELFILLYLSFLLPCYY